MSGMEPKILEAGTKVRIKQSIKDMKIDKYGVHVSPEMRRYAGKETTIISVIQGKHDPSKIRYFLAIDRRAWFWTDQMLEVVK